MNRADIRPFTTGPASPSPCQARLTNRLIGTPFSRLGRRQTPIGRLAFLEKIPKSTYLLPPFAIQVMWAIVPEEGSDVVLPQLAPFCTLCEKMFSSVRIALARRWVPATTGTCASRVPKVMRATICNNLQQKTWEVISRETPWGQDSFRKETKPGPGMFAFAYASVSTPHVHCYTGTGPPKLVSKSFMLFVTLNSLSAPLLSVSVPRPLISMAREPNFTHVAVFESLLR